MLSNVLDANNANRELALCPMWGKSNLAHGQNSLFLKKHLTLGWTLISHKRPQRQNASDLEHDDMLDGRH